MIGFYDNDMNLIEQKYLLNLKFKEKVIIEKSIELFNDDDPCIIHYTYCNRKLGIELLAKLEEVAKSDSPVKITDSPVDISDLILPSDSVYFKMN